MPFSSDSDSKSLQFSLRSMMLVVILVGMFLTILVFLHRASEVKRIDNEIFTSFRRMALGIKNYYSPEFGSGFMPAPVKLNDAGEALYSWRLALVPFVGTWHDPPEWDAAWNAQANKALADSPCWPYCSSLIQSAATTDTIVFAVSGVGTAFDPTRLIRREDVPDETIIMMEVANSDVHWMEPGDYEVTELVSCNGCLKDCLPGNISGRFYVLFADGEVWCLKDATPMERIHPFLTLKGAAQTSREKQLDKYCLSRWSTYRIDGSDEQSTEQD